MIRLLKKARRTIENKLLQHIKNIAGHVDYGQLAYCTYPPPTSANAVMSMQKNSDGKLSDKPALGTNSLMPYRNRHQFASFPIVVTPTDKDSSGFHNCY